MSETENKNKKDIEGQDSQFAAAPEGDLEQSHHMRTTDEIYTGQEYQSSSEQEKPEKKPGVGKDISILVMITLAAGVLLGAAYGVTKDPIAQAQAKAKAQAQNAVMPDADSFKVLYTSDGSEGEKIPDSYADAVSQAGIDTTTVTQIDAALDENGEHIGYVITSSNPEGYGGDVEVMSGITKEDDGSVTVEGISFLSLSETAGMGMRAKDDEFKNQFDGLQLEEEQLIEYVKDGAEASNEIDAISGCTITTSAVTDNINAALITVGQTSGSAGTTGGDEVSTEKDSAGLTGVDEVSTENESPGKEETTGSEEAAEGASEPGQEESE